MTKFFADTAVFSFAQADCAAFSCAAHNSMIILNASLILLALLASFFVLLLADLAGKKTEHSVRITTHFLPSLPISRTR